MSNKIFLDCGAWKGNSIFHFLDTFPNAKEYQIYSFECNPDILKKLYKNLKINKTKNIQVIEKALWIKEGPRTFKRGVNQYSESCSLIQEKRILRHNKLNDIRVRCIDFSRWVHLTLKRDDFVICKMNIEGTEYRVLNHMIEKNTLAFLDELLICWHWKKIRMEEEKHLAFLIKLKEAAPHLKIKGWALEHGD